MSKRAVQKVSGFSTRMTGLHLGPISHRVYAAETGIVFIAEQSCAWYSVEPLAMHREQNALYWSLKTNKTQSRTNYHTKSEIKGTVAAISLTHSTSSCQHMRVFGGTGVCVKVCMWMFVDLVMCACVCV